MTLPFCIQQLPTTFVGLDTAFVKYKCIYFRPEALVTSPTQPTSGCMIGTVAGPKVPMCPLLLQRVHTRLCLPNISSVSSLENSSSLRIKFVRLL